MASDEADERRKKLREMRDNLPDISPSEDEIQGAEMLGFVKTLKEQKDKRTKQFSIIKQLFDDPLTFDLDKEIIPTSSSAEEIAARQKELGYRIDILKSILEITESEMQILSQAMRSKLDDGTEETKD